MPRTDTPIATSGTTQTPGSPGRYDSPGPVDVAQQLLDVWTHLPAGHPDLPRARGEVIEAYLPMAARQARRFSHRGESLQDLTQVANIGLIHAVDRFDPDYGARFASFAIPTIRGEIKRHFRDRCWTIQPPRNVQELRPLLESAVQSLTQQLSRSPTVAELAGAVDADVDTVRKTLGAWQLFRLSSLNAPPRTVSEAESQLSDLLGAPDPALDTAADRMSLRSALGVLTERDRTIVILRFFHDMKQDQIAHRTGVSQMHVSRLLTHALRQMRAFLNDDDPVAPIVSRSRSTPRRDAGPPARTRKEPRAAGSEPVTSLPRQRAATRAGG